MDIIILAILTVYIFYRLNKNFGKIDEEEKREIHKRLLERKKQIEEILMRTQSNVDANSNPSANSPEKIIGSKSTIDSKIANLDSATQENLTKIFNACNINYDFFINGTKMAFDMIVNAFAKEDIETLQLLLSDKIFEGFAKAINDRKAQGQVLVTNLISVDKVEILSAMTLDNIASIAVKIYSKQINYLTNQAGELVQGKKDEIFNMIDIWTFKKDITSPNPNWKVSATSN